MVLVLQMVLMMLNKYAIALPIQEKKFKHDRQTGNGKVVPLCPLSSAGEESVTFVD